MHNLNLKLKKNLSAGRKLALGTWGPSRDPSIYGKLTIRMDKTLKYIEEFKKVTGKRLTVSHIMAKVMGEVFKEVPEANSIIRGNKIYLRENISVFFPVALKDAGEFDISGSKVDEPDKKTLIEICEEFDLHVKKVKTFKDTDLAKSRKLIKSLPYFLLRPFLWFISFFSLGLNLDLSKWGIPQDAFGSVMLTNIGSLGLEDGHVPLVPYSRVPIIIAIGAIQDTPVVENSKVIAAKTMSLYATIDHRLLDGAHASVMANIIKKCFDNPSKYFDNLD